jgi:hypothetical protein
MSRKNPTPPVDLEKFLETLDLANDLFVTFIDPDTGEVFWFQEDLIRRAKEWDGESSLDDEGWEAEDIRKIKPLLAKKNRWIEMPTQFDADEYSMMVDFANDQSDEAIQDDLLDAISGKGAFRRFKDAVRRLGVDEKWYAFRDEAFRVFAKNWLEDEGLTYFEKKENSEAS